MGVLLAYDEAIGKYMLATLSPVALNPDNALIQTDPRAPDMEKFHDQGVLLIRSVYSDAWVAALRERVERVVHRSMRDGWSLTTYPGYPGLSILGDLLGMEELGDLDYLVFNPRIVGYAKSILGDDVIYFGDSGIRLGNGGRGFHKDFQEETRSRALLLRFALYLQDHSDHSGGLKVRLKSHRHLSRHVGQMMNVYTRAGDLVIFDHRISHTGNNVRLRALPGVCLHPKLENRIPRSLRVPEQRARLVILWTFARPGSHLDRYIERITESHEHWKRSGWNRRLLDLAQATGITLRKSTSDQASLLPAVPALAGPATRES